jgi:hypothetical protein
MDFPISASFFFQKSRQSRSQHWIRRRKASRLVSTAFSLLIFLEKQFLEDSLVFLGHDRLAIGLPAKEHMELAVDLVDFLAGNRFLVHQPEKLPCETRSGGLLRANEHIPVWRILIPDAAGEDDLQDAPDFIFASIVDIA